MDFIEGTSPRQLARTFGGLYLVNIIFGAFALGVVPGVAAHLGAWTGLPTIIAEGSLCLWLLLAAVDSERWKEQAKASIRARAARMEGPQ